MTPASQPAQLGARRLTPLVLLGILVGLLLGPAPEQTHATWVDAEAAQSDPLRAVKLQPPMITKVTCEKDLLGLLLGRLDVSWQYPLSTPMAGTQVSVAWSTANGALASTPIVSGPDTNGIYSTTFRSGLLQDLLALLLGGAGDIELRTRVQFPDGQIWVSEQASRIEIRSLPLLGPSCTVVNAP